MINTSTEYKSMIRRNRRFIPKATITLADSTILQITASDIMSGGLKIDDSVGDKVSLGPAIINKCSLTLNNFSGKFDAYDFTGAEMRPYIGLQLSKTIENLSKGVFNTDRPTVNGPIIVLEALDNMAKFDTEFSNVTITFPCTALQLLQAVCLYCGVNLATVKFLNSTYVIEARPDDESISCREIVSWIAQIAGCYARCNVNGALVLDWYDFEAFEAESNLDGGMFDKGAQYTSGDNADGGNFTDYNSGDNYDGGTFLDTQRYHHLYSFSGEPTIGTDDIYITGIQVTDSSESPTTVLFGSSGYVLPITDNKLIQSANQAKVIANSVGKKIVGMRFRSFSGNTLSDPSMEAGDVGYASTRKGNSYPILFTSLSFSLGSAETVSCGAETPAQRYYRPTQEMKAIIESRKYTQQKITAYDQAVQQLTNLMTNSFGVHKSEEKLEDGSYIYYMHNKPTVAESSTIWKMTADAFAVSTDGGKTWNAGFDSNGNAVVNVLNAIGINADWINTGSITSKNGASKINLDNGTFNLGNSNLYWDGTKLVAKGHIEANSGKIGKFNISNNGLENDTFKLYEADGAPWMWMYNLLTGESVSVQTIGFAKRHQTDKSYYMTDLQSDFLSFEELDAEGSRTQRELKIDYDGITLSNYSDDYGGDFWISTPHGTLQFTEFGTLLQSNFGGMLAFDGEDMTLATKNCTIGIYGDNIYINSNNTNDGHVYIDGHDINNVIQRLYEAEQDIQIIKKRVGLSS